jgi:hypothetical protein
MSQELKRCCSPYCECDPGKCSNPGFYDARHEAAEALRNKQGPPEHVPVIGYDKLGQPIRQPRGLIYTQAFILCCQCNAPISGHGGPRYGSVCLSCHDKTKKENP